jgi:RNA polymerase sigma-70 factor (ECF subfamily)
MTLALSTLGDELAEPAEPDEKSWSELYDEHFDFVWRSLRRLGVPVASLDDAAQDVFVVALRRRADFEGRSGVKTWLFGIAWNIARNLSRSKVRREDPLPEAIVDGRHLGQDEAAARSEAVGMLYELLDGLDDEKRAVFVMAELEEMGAKDIAAVTGVPENTVYSRLRAARSAFEAGLRRMKAKDTWKQRCTTSAWRRRH